MLFYGLLFTLLAAVSAEHCYTEVGEACGTGPVKDTLMPNCNAKYGKIDLLETDLQAYAKANIESSFEYLLMSTYFGNYDAQREGLKDLYRKYSDKTWADAIDVIKYITQRGGKMNMNQLPHFKKSTKDSRVLELNELGSLAKALDTQKDLAKEAMRIHEEAQPHNKHDPAVAHYIEEKFFESHTKCVRDLAGYTNDLKNLLTEHNPSVAVFLFDEFLKKSL